MSKLEQRSIGTTSKTYSPNQERCSITFGNLTKEEIQQLEYALESGLGWITFRDGRLEVIDRYDSPPIPNESDKPMAGFWTPVPRRTEIAVAPPPHAPKRFEWGEITPYSYPSITIQHLCGYDWTPEKYDAQALRLQSYGFSCLRSKRAKSGKYWEIWHLPDLFLAEGELGDVLNKECVVCSNCGSTNIARRFYGDAPKYPDQPLQEMDVSCSRCYHHVCHRTFGRLVKVPQEPKEKLKRAVEFLGNHISFGTLDVSVQRLAMVMD